MFTMSTITKTTTTAKGLSTDEIREMYGEWLGATVKDLASADQITARAFDKVVAKYHLVGDGILSRGLTYGQAAWAAMSKDAEDAKREQAREDGKQARPDGQQSYRRAWQIATRVAKDYGGDLAAAIAAYDGDMSLSAFAAWCGSESAPKPPKTLAEHAAALGRKIAKEGANIDEMVAILMAAYGEAMGKMGE